MEQIIDNIHYGTYKNSEKTQNGVYFGGNLNCLLRSEPVNFYLNIKQDVEQIVDNIHQLQKYT